MTLYLRKDILLPKRREHLNFVQLASVFYKKKNLFSDIAGINGVVNFYNNDYAMNIV